MASSITEKLKNIGPVLWSQLVSSVLARSPRARSPAQAMVHHVVGVAVRHRCNHYLPGDGGSRRIVTQEGLGENIRDRISHPVLKWIAIVIVIIAIFIGNTAYETGNITGGILGIQAVLPDVPMILSSSFWVFWRSSPCGLARIRWSRLSSRPSSCSWAWCSSSRPSPPA